MLVRPVVRLALLYGAGYLPLSAPIHCQDISTRQASALTTAFGPKLAVFFRLGMTPSQSAARSLSALTNTQFNTQTYTVGATSQLSNRLTNEFRIGLCARNVRSDRYVGCIWGCDSGRSCNGNRGCWIVESISDLLHINPRRRKFDSTDSAKLKQQ